MGYEPKIKYHAVWTSGAINYSYNLKHKVQDIIEKIKSFVKPKGFIYFDYMLPLEPHHFERDNYFKKGELVNYFSGKNWEVIIRQSITPINGESPC